MFQCHVVCLPPFVVEQERQGQVAPYLRDPVSLCVRQEGEPCNTEYLAHHESDQHLGGNIQTNLHAAIKAY